MDLCLKECVAAFLRFCARFMIQFVSHEQSFGRFNDRFVTLDTQSKDDMFNVMFALRTKKFPSGESVNARLKSMGAPANSVSPVNIRYIQPEIPMLYAPQLQSGRNSNGKKSNNGRKKRNSSGASGSGNKLTLADKSGKGKNLNGSSQRRGTSNNGQTKQQQKKGSGSKQQDVRDTTVKAPSPSQTPPAFGDEQFPALPSEELKKVEFDQDDNDSASV